MEENAKEWESSKAELLTEEGGQNIISLFFAECSSVRKILGIYCGSMIASLGPG